MNRDLSAENRPLVTWVTIHTSPDEWEARLVRTALINEGIRCRLESRRVPSGQSSYELMVQSLDELEARDLVAHVLNVLLSQPEDIEEPPASVRAELSIEPDPEPIGRDIPRASPTAYESVVIATRDGVGEIVHHLGRGFELRVGPRPYYIVEESRWDEFTDFSAQRQEFSILLRAEYTNLYQWIRENKLMAEFIHLVESTYRDVPPPRLPRRNRADALPVNPLAMSSTGIALLAIFGTLLSLPWYINLGLGLAALFCGLLGRYQIGLSGGRQRGVLLAMLGVGIACVVIAVALVTRQTTQSPVLGRAPIESPRGDIRSQTGGESAYPLFDRVLDSLCVTLRSSRSTSG